MDNLTKYLDNNDDGFIQIDLFDSEMRTATNMVVGGGANPGSNIGRGNSIRSEGAGTMGGSTTQKWTKKSSTNSLGQK